MTRRAAPARNVSPVVFAFDDYELDRKTLELRVGGRPLHIEPKVFDVLGYLVEHRQRVVTKDELLQRFWPDVTVTEWALSRTIAAARRILGGNADARRIVTAHGRGYRFVGEVVERRAAARPTGSDDTLVAGSPFVDRDRLMETLDSALDDVWNGRGRIVLLCGEAGIGKTRALDALTARATARDATVATGRGMDGRGAPAFWPWIQVFREVVAAGGDDLRERIGHSAEDLAAFVPECFTPGDRPSTAIPALADEARFRLFDGLVATLKAAATMRPLIVVLDDLHFADAASLALLEFVAHEIPASRMLVAAADRGRPSSSRLRRLAGEAHASAISLTGISATGVARLIELSIGERVSEALARRVHARTAGNPFFVREVASLLRDRRDDASDRDQIAGSAIPLVVQDLVRIRLSRLTGGCRRLLETAAVAGAEVERSTLARAMTLSGRALDATAGEAIAATFLRETAAGATVVFSHSIVREAIYEALTPARRRGLHRRIGEAIAKAHGGNAASRVADLAHHFLEAAAPGAASDRALGYVEEAARVATALHAHEATAALYRRALVALGGRRSASRPRARLLLGLGAAFSKPGDRAEARETFLRAAAEARAARDPELFARAALGLGGRGEFGGLPDRRLRLLLDEALAMLPAKERPLRARILARLVGLSPHSDSMQARDDMSRSAMAVARRARDAEALADALNARNWALSGPDHVEERLAIGAELVALGERSHSDETSLLGHGHRIGAFLESADMVAADGEIETFARMAEALRQPLYLWFGSRYRAVRAFGDGRFADAERLAHEGFTLAKRAQNPYGFATFSGITFYLLRERGELGPELEGGIRFMRENYSGLGPLLQILEMSFFAAVGRREDARAVLDRFAEAGFTELRRDENWLLILSELAEVAARVEAAEPAAALYRLLSPYARRNVMHGALHLYVGSAERHLGLLAATLGHLDQAAPHFESALAANLRMSARPALARTQADFARMLLRSDRVADRSRARLLVTDASTIAGALGMRGLQRDLAELGRGARGARPSK